MTDTTKYAVRAIVGGGRRNLRILTGFAAVEAYGDSITGTGVGALLVSTGWKKTRGRISKELPMIDVWVCEDLLSTTSFKIVAIRETDYQVSRSVSAEARS